MATLETYLSTSWRVGRTAAAVCDALPAPFGTAATLATAQAPRSGVRTGKPVEEVVAGQNPSAFVSPAFVTLDEAGAGMARGFVEDFYYHIWVIPQTLALQNPRPNTDIPFLIWNAYPYDNDVEVITGTDADGLELDLVPVDTFSAIELRTVNLRITPSAPIQIDASFLFEFTEGSGILYFTADIADFVQMQPDPPVSEQWAWLTDVIENRDGSEQRIALRGTPRRTIKYGFMLESEAERRRQYNRWFKSLPTRLVIPYYQYSTALIQDSAAGESKLYFDPARTDLRDGEFAIVYEAQTDAGYLVKIGTVDADGATLDAPLTFSATADMIIAPAFTSRLFDNTGFTMKYVTGNIQVQAESLVARSSFTRPGSTAVIPTFDGLPVLDIRPISQGDVPEVFDANYEVIDGITGVQDIFTSWPHPAVGTTRKWTIRRLQNPGEMDWWRDFLDGAKGRQNPFLMPTWFADLYAAEAPALSSTQLTLQASDYSALYFPYEAYKRLQIETAAGIIWRKVVSCSENEDGTTTLELDAAFGATAEDVDIQKISFLNLVRLSTDTVSLTHERIRTRIELTTRTIDS